MSYGISHLRTTEGFRVIKFNTVARVLYTLVVCLALAEGASAQTVLNFAKATVNDRANAGFSIANPTSHFADVQFTLYGWDGSLLSAGVANPVRYRVAPQGQISMRANEIFGTSKADGWVQVTSSTSGLSGFYTVGDFNFKTMLEGSGSAAPLSTQ